MREQVTSVPASAAQADGTRDSAARSGTVAGDQELCDRLQDDLRGKWQRGERVHVEHYFQLHPALAQDEEAALDLIYCEFLIRSDLGDVPDSGEYLRRFPEHTQRLHFLFS